VVSGLWIHPEKLRYQPQKRKEYTKSSKDFEVDNKQITLDSSKGTKILFPEFASPKS
jgi:hypothetical protein